MLRGRPEEPPGNPFCPSSRPGSAAQPSRGGYRDARRRRCATSPTATPAPRRCASASRSRMRGASPARALPWSSWLGSARRRASCSVCCRSGRPRSRSGAPWSRSRRFLRLRALPCDPLTHERRRRGQVEEEVAQQRPDGESPVAAARACCAGSAACPAARHRPARPSCVSRRQTNIGTFSRPPWG